MVLLDSTIIILLSANIVLLCIVLIMLWRIARYFYPIKIQGRPIRQRQGTKYSPDSNSKPPRRRYNARKH